MKLKDKAQFFYEQFATKDRNGEQIVVFKGTRTNALHDSVMKAHGDRLPDDWIFDKYHSILGTIADYDIERASDLDDKRSEIVDGLVDVYTSDLTAWLHSDNRNVYYLEEAQKEYGEAPDGFALLMRAQYMAIDEIFSEVQELLTT